MARSMVGDSTLTRSHAHTLTRSHAHTLTRPHSLSYAPKHLVAIIVTTKRILATPIAFQVCVWALASWPPSTNTTNAAQTFTRARRGVLEWCLGRQWLYIVSVLAAPHNMIPAVSISSRAWVSLSPEYTVPAERIISRRFQTTRAVVTQRTRDCCGSIQYSEGWRRQAELVDFVGWLSELHSLQWR
jgi:hypothetical protein